MVSVTSTEPSVASTDFESKLAMCSPTDCAATGLLIETSHTAQHARPASTEALRSIAAGTRREWVCGVRRSRWIIT